MTTIMRHYDTVQWTAETFPKNLTFDMRCDVALGHHIDADSNGAALWCNPTDAIIARLEADGLISRQEKEVGYDLGRYRYILDRQASLFGKAA